MSVEKLRQREREDVILCAATMAWSAGLNFWRLPTSAPDERPWEHDKEAFVTTALVILGHRGMLFSEFVAQGSRLNALREAEER